MENRKYIVGMLEGEKNDNTSKIPIPIIEESKESTIMEQKKRRLAVLRIAGEKKKIKDSYEIELFDKSRIKIEYINDFKWRLGIRGKKGTLWEDGLYCATISFPFNYPDQPPEIIFDIDFEHIHIYESGNICLDLVNKELTYNISTSMSLIISEIDRLIHGSPNIKSPANAQLCNIYINNTKIYEERIKNNAKKLSKKELI